MNLKNKICIDFQGGAHGNYLEFVCNKFLAQVRTCENLPFNKLGSSHKKQYLTEPDFKSWHFFEHRGIRTTPSNGKIISIQINYDDLLPLSLVSLLRAGDHNICPEDLEKNTYHKLNNADYQSILDNIINSFFLNHVKDSYAAVKDPSWPYVENYNDFLSLPSNIKKECVEFHNLKLLQFDENNPDCPRGILREFFRIGFSDPSKSGFVTAQKEKMRYSDEADVFVFPFSAFYDIKKFLHYIECVAIWANYNGIKDRKKLVELHNIFLEKQIFKNAKNKCDFLIKNYIEKGANFSFPKLNVLEEAYIESKLDKIIF